MVIEILGRDPVNPAHLFHPADHGTAIRMGVMQRGAHLFAHQRLGIIVHPHAALFHHHVALGPDMGVGQVQVHQPVGFQLHGQRQPVPGDLFVEGGVVVIGEGVVLAAIAGDGLGEGVVRIGLGAAEHHVFEEMRQPGNARRIVHAADAEPQHLGGDGGAVIGDHQHLHAIGQRELEGVVAGLARIGRRGRRQLAAILDLGPGGGCHRQRRHQAGQRESCNPDLQIRTSQTSRRFLSSGQERSSWRRCACRSRHRH